MIEAEDTSGTHESWLLRNKDRVTAGVLLVFGLSWMWAASRQTYLVDTPHVSLSFMPFAAGAILAVLSGVWLILPKSGASEGDDVVPIDADVPESVPASGFLRPWVRVILAFVALSIYALVLFHVHSLLSSFGLVAAGLLLAGEPLRLRTFLIAALVAAVLYAIFILWLAVPLPGGRYT